MMSTGDGAFPGNPTMLSVTIRIASALERIANYFESESAGEEEYDPINLELNMMASIHGSYSDRIKDILGDGSFTGLKAKRFRELQEEAEQTSNQANQRLKLNHDQEAEIRKRGAV